MNSISKILIACFLFALDVACGAHPRALRRRSRALSRQELRAHLPSSLDDAAPHGARRMPATASRRSSGCAARAAVAQR